MWRQMSSPAPRRSRRWRRSPAAHPPTQAGFFADWTAEQAESVLEPGPTRCCAPRWIRICRRWRKPARRHAERPAPRQCQPGRVVVLDAPPARYGPWRRARLPEQAVQRAVLARGSRARASSPSCGWPRWKRRAPDDTVLDAPIRVGNWVPQDFERRYLGPITLEEALAQSINTARAAGMQAGGPGAVADVAHRWASPTRCRKTPRWRWAPAVSACWK